jgi:hypothetical protein
LEAAHWLQEQAKHDPGDMVTTLTVVEAVSWLGGGMKEV